MLTLWQISNNPLVLYNIVHKRHIYLILVYQSVDFFKKKLKAQEVF